MGIRPTVALINEDALRDNYLKIKALTEPSTCVMAIIKANGYGHGEAIVAKALTSAGASTFGVAIIEEGVSLRRGGVSYPIVILGGVYPEQIKDLLDFNLTPVVFDIANARLINEASQKKGQVTPVHIKIDTGMGRLGIMPTQVLEFFAELKSLTSISVEGILSHLARSESKKEPDITETKKQLQIFKEASRAARSIGFNPKYTHIANSAAILDYKDSHLSMIRPGLMLYGAYPAPDLRERIALTPVMTLKTRILEIKKMPKGSPISYGGRFVTKRGSLIATIPIGYGDGLPRAYSSKGEVLVRGKRVPIAGTICMDLTMIDVTDIGDVRKNDEVIIIGSAEKETITVEEVAERTSTISYEIFCNISARVPRLQA
ncbi:MAG: alanine racemase [Deltaproteobacteria bacterium]|nr:alanine racemase [Deltaproteobacteria bacterium]